MKIDNNDLEKEAMSNFTSGDIKKAQQLQNEFLEQVKKSGKDYCSCTGNCKYHGKCVECVIIHRGHSEHLPNCFRDMVNKRIEELSSLTEHSFKKNEE